jgi:hypothetical protein
MAITRLMIIITFAVTLTNCGNFLSKSSDNKLIEAGFFHGIKIFNSISVPPECTLYDDEEVQAAFNRFGDILTALQYLWNDDGFDIDPYTKAVEEFKKALLGGAGPCKDVLKGAYDLLCKVVDAANSSDFWNEVIGHLDKDVYIEIESKTVLALMELGLNQDYFRSGELIGKLLRHVFFFNWKQNSHSMKEKIEIGFFSGIQIFNGIHIPQQCPLFEDPEVRKALDKFEDAVSILYATIVDFHSFDRFFEVLEEFKQAMLGAEGPCKDVLKSAYDDVLMKVVANAETLDYWTAVYHHFVDEYVYFDIFAKGFIALLEIPDNGYHRIGELTGQALRNLFFFNWQ